MNKFIGLLLLSLVLLGSCKTKESIVKKNQVETYKLDNIQLSLPIIKTANFSSLTVEINAQGNAFTTHASMKIVKDSIIQISIQPALGIEMARVDFTKNGFVLIDKMNGRYFTSGYDFLLAKYKILLDYNSLQAILLNNLFLVGAAPEPYDSLMMKFTKSSFPDGVSLKSIPTKVPVPTEFTLNKDLYINYLSISMPLSLMTCRYIDFEKKDEINFPSKYKFSIMDGPRTSEANITIHAVEFNKLVKINTTDLSNYEQVNTFEQIIP